MVVRGTYDSAVMSTYGNHIRDMNNAMGLLLSIILHHTKFTQCVQKLDKVAVPMRFVTNNLKSNVNF